MTTETKPRQARGSEFTPERQVFEPHRTGLPPLGPYVREVWRRREFAREMSRTQLRAQHFNTVFGQVWLLINPILLACVYFILVDILQRGSRGPDFFGHLVAGIFAYYLFQQSLSHAVNSVTSGGKLILNSAFPRVLLPLASVVTAFTRFLPTVLIYIPVHLVTGLPVGPELLWAIPLIGLLIVLATGLSMLVASVQVYFRDLREFLPYILRVWLYVTPILYYADQVPDRYDVVLAINPLGPVFTGLSDVLDRGQAPSAGALGLAVAWAVGAFVVGGLFFISRERDFAVRL